MGVDARRGYSAVEEEEEWELMRGENTVLWKKKRSESCCEERIQCCGRRRVVGVVVMRGYSAVEEEEE